MDLVENTGLYNSDGVNTFATGAFAPGVTVSDVTYRMLAADAGVKWRGLSVNAAGSDIRPVGCTKTPRACHLTLLPARHARAHRPQ
jgi:hypothetical protein